MSRTDYIKMLTFACVVLQFLTYVSDSSANSNNLSKAYDGCIKPDVDLVTLSGKLIEKDYRDANNNVERALVLILSKRICTIADEIGGPFDGINEVQIVIANNLYGMIKASLNRQISVTGRIFHQISAHHHTKVLLHVENIVDHSSKNK